MQPTTKHSFLVVDDEPHVLDSIYDLLRRDYKVLRAGSASEARQVMQHETVHIVMSDERMPDVSGIELLREFKVKHPDTIRLLFTAYADLQVVVSAINEGEVFRYIDKGSGPDELRTVVKQAADYFELRSERKRLIAELQRANTELRTANALKAAFLDVASHELNTPVTIILGMSELAQELLEQPGGERFRNYIRVVRSGARRLDHLVGNMLKLLQAGSFESGIETEPVPCQVFFDRVSEQVMMFLSFREQTLRIRLDPPDAVLLVDRGKMHDVMLNLIMNAIKFSPDRAEIEVRVRVTADSGVRIEVADSGLGIPERDLPHVFEPFFSTFDTLHHSSGSFEYGKRGLGMGLAIARKFVEMHGGTIRVEPRQPRGSCFIVELPKSATISGSACNIKSANPEDSLCE